MSLWQLSIVKEKYRNLPLKFGQNQMSKSWDIADIEFPVVVGGGGGGVKSFLWLRLCMVELWLSWSFDSMLAWPNFTCILMGSVLNVIML